MTPVLYVARDLLREAASRKWLLGLAIAITVLLATIGLSLRMDVVDGALSGTRLFGKLVSDDILSVDVALRPVFMGAAWIVFYGGTLFMVLACADFAPSLLSPGRIEHLLALPVRRWQLLAGTYLGVLTLWLAMALYGSAGLVVILGIKTGVWTSSPIAAAVLASAAFATIYAAMLTTALFVRSTALSAAVGVLVFAFGIVAGYRHNIAPLFESGVRRDVFRAATFGLPRIGALGSTCGELAAGKPVDTGNLLAMLAGFAVFSVAALAIGAWRFEQKDF